MTDAQRDRLADAEARGVSAQVTEAEQIAERVKAHEETLRRQGILPEDDQPPFDIIGDVHGCIDELRELLARLGYEHDGEVYQHPAGRRLVFVGDFTDRGPGSAAVGKLVLGMYERGRALAVIGNHDFKLLRWLLGRHVRPTHGFALTVSDIAALPETEQYTFKASWRHLLDSLPGYLILDEGKLVVTHGAIMDDMIGEWNEEVASVCRYGDVAGVQSDGKPLRLDWGGLRSKRFALDDMSPRIVYGHNVVEAPEWVNRTIDIDTGCVFGGALTALRYPELELVQVPAHDTYWERR